MEAGGARCWGTAAAAGSGGRGRAGRMAAMLWRRVEQGEGDRELRFLSLGMGKIFYKLKFRKLGLGSGFFEREGEKENVMWILDIQVLY